LICLYKIEDFVNELNNSKNNKNLKFFLDCYQDYLKGEIAESILKNNDSFLKSIQNKKNEMIVKELFEKLDEEESGKMKKNS
jgi:uncharacterized protein YaaR (DUF327 family)